MRTAALITVIVLAGCGADGSGPPRGDASTNGDGTLGDAQGAGSVACNDEMTSCLVPAQVCCDITTGTDTCVATNAACAGERMECDGPEDCAVTEECCWFAGQGSRCLDDGVCGMTGEVMCHDMTQCAIGEQCCGTAPGPLLDLYFACRAGNTCPQ